MRPDWFMEERMAIKLLGVLPVTNCGSICVHEIEDDRVLASISGQRPEWCSTAERPLSDYIGDEAEADEMTSGFMFGRLFVPFCAVMRV